MRQLRVTTWRSAGVLTTATVGSLLEKNLSKAVEMALKQRQVANNFTATFTRQTVQAWSRMVKEWEADPSYPNPYISKEQGTPFSIPWGLVYLIIIFVSIEGFGGAL